MDIHKVLIVTGSMNSVMTKTRMVVNMRVVVVVHLIQGIDLLVMLRLEQEMEQDLVEMVCVIRVRRLVRVRESVFMIIWGM